jgi:hypothetical protein
MFEGKKTFIGLIIALLGLFGLGDVFLAEEVSSFANNLLELFGIVMAWYGRLAATKTYVE